MKEIIKINCITQSLEIVPSSTLEQSYPLFEGISNQDIQSVDWLNFAQECSQHQLFWCLRKIQSRLANNAVISLIIHPDTILSEKIFFPADWLGAIGAPIEMDNGDYGFQLAGIHQGGIAERAGLKIDDILLKWGDQSIDEFQRPWLSFKGINSKSLTIEYSRAAQQSTVKVRCSPPLNNREVLSNIAVIMGWEEQDEGIYIKRLPTLSKSPLVSVLMHAYKPRWFAEALQSVLDQSYDNLEIIIGDDNSKGEIKAIVDELAPDDTRIRYFLNDPPYQGWGTGNRYFCFAQATGELIKYLCDDDVLESKCIENMISVLIEHPEVSLVSSHRLTIDASSNISTPRRYTRRVGHQNMIIDGLNATNVFFGLAFNNIGEPSTTMFRRQQAEHFLGYLDSFMGIEAASGIDDVSLWCSLLMKGKLGYLAEVQSRFRITDSQASTDPRLLSDIKGKWVLQVGIYYRSGVMVDDRDFRLHPLILKNDIEDLELGDCTPTELYQYLLRSDLNLDGVNRGTLSEILRRNTDWPVLSLLIKEKIKGTVFPSNPKKATALSNQLIDKIYFSFNNPVNFLKSVSTHPFYMYLVSLPFACICTCGVFGFVSKGTFEIVMSHNHGEWKALQIREDNIEFFLENDRVDHLLRFRGYDKKGNQILIKVEVKGYRSAK